jgi:preprotein translocase subunit SecG
MEQLLIFLLVIIAVALVALILIQHGKGADVGAAFGSGASNTMFGSQGSTSFLFKVTLGLAVAFFVLLVVLTRINTSHAKNNNVLALPKAAQSQPGNKNITTIPTVPTKS